MTDFFSGFFFCLDEILISSSAAFLSTTVNVAVLIIFLEFSSTFGVFGEMERLIPSISEALKSGTSFLDLITLSTLPLVFFLTSGVSEEYEFRSSM